MRRGFSPRFFADLPAGAPAAGTRLKLCVADAHHVRSVLRARPGDPCEVVLLPPPAAPERSAAAIDPGAAAAAGVTAEPRVPGLPTTPPGLFAAAHIAEIGRDAVVVELDEAPQPTADDRVRVVLCQALPQLSRVDELLEKGTEVGVAAFVLFPADGSPRIAADRLGDRISRWERITREAAKQSKQMVVPPVRVAASLDAAVDLVARAGLASLVCEPLGGLTAAEALPPAVTGGSVALWVGPEGGWSDGERARFEALEGVRLVTLGRRILRTETAGPVAAALAHFVAGDW
jgi:16S rRNA (uracil1498-N3)-methyltransferase